MALNNSSSLHTEHLSFQLPQGLQSNSRYQKNHSLYLPPQNFSTPSKCNSLLSSLPLLLSQPPFSPAPFLRSARSNTAGPSRTTLPSTPASQEITCAQLKTVSSTRTARLPATTQLPMLARTASLLPLPLATVKSLTRTPTFASTISSFALSHTPTFAERLATRPASTSASTELSSRFSLTIWSSYGGYTHGMR